MTNNHIQKIKKNIKNYLVDYEYYRKYNESCYHFVAKIFGNW